MSKTKSRAVLVDGRPYQKKADGSMVPLKGKTDWKRLDRQSSVQTDAIARKDRDGRPMTDQEWARAEVIHPGRWLSASSLITTFSAGSSRKAKVIRPASIPSCGAITRRIARRDKLPTSFRGASTDPREARPDDANPESRSVSAQHLWIPGSREGAHPGMTAVVYRTSTFLNCHGSLASMSSGNSPGRSVSGVQSV
jgi:hypothetical protein